MYALVISRLCNVVHLFVIKLVANRNFDHLNFFLSDRFYTSILQHRCPLCNTCFVKTLIKYCALDTR